MAGGDTNYIIEYIVHGSYTKVSAIDPRTGREVSIVGATRVSREELAQLAVRKLEYILDKKKNT